MSDLTIGQRANNWRRRKHLSTNPDRVMNKLTEEVGELARAMIGEFEERSGRGDVVQEAAQVRIVLDSLMDILRPGIDMDAAVKAEMERLGA